TSTGRVLMSWSNFTPFAPGGVEISTTFSDNIMDVMPVWSARSVVAADTVDGQASIPRFAGNGSPNVYLAWRRFPGTNTNNVGFARSTDNGATWSSPVNTTSDFFTMDEVLGDDAVNTSPGMTVDNSSGPGKGTIYLLFSNNDLKDGADIVVQRSTDGGLPFTKGLPSTRMETPMVVFKGVPANSLKVTLTPNFNETTVTDGNGNGFIDAGEQVRFKLPLTNYVTNTSLNPTVITGIVATLS